VERILELLDSSSCTATFFVLGWLARREGGLVRRIAEAGHEIASHGMSHRMLQRLDRRGFAAELADSRALLEDLAGTAVEGFRAPTFSLTHRTAWALDVLAEGAWRYDSSIFPVRHDRYGVPEAPRRAHLAVGPAGGRVLEMPPLTGRMFGANLPVGGGGYLRLLPVGWVAAALRSFRRAGGLAVIYLHPWELDPDQPELPLSPLSRWRHRVNLSRTAGKLRRLLEGFRLTSFRDVLPQVEAATVETYSYGLGDAPGEA
jgi:polysaccharide deacetylase family protein (PEP-CTERM system associated)